MSKDSCCLGSHSCSQVFQMSAARCERPRQCEAASGLERRASSSGSRVLALGKVKQNASGPTHIIIYMYNILIMAMKISITYHIVSITYDISRSYRYYYNAYNRGLGGFWSRVPGYFLLPVLPRKLPWAKISSISCIVPLSCLLAS